MTPHAWEELSVVSPAALPDPSRELVCRRCGTRLARRLVEPFIRVPGYADCDHALALAVMES